MADVENVNVSVTIHGTSSAIVKALTAINKYNEAVEGTEEEEVVAPVKRGRKPMRCFGPSSKLGVYTQFFSSVYA